MPEQLLTLPQVAERLQVPLKTLYAMRSKRTAPRGIRVGRHIRIRESDLDAWLEAHADGRDAA